MFIGHFAVAFAAKRFAPRAALALLIAAPLFLDMLWPIFLLLGWEHARIAPGDTRYTPLDLYDYPWSHSLLMAAVWATAFALIYFGVARYKAGAVATWIGVVSHGCSTGLRTDRTCPGIQQEARDWVLGCGTRLRERWLSRPGCWRWALEST
jgi:hypothetical protein